MNSKKYQKDEIPYDPVVKDKRPRGHGIVFDKIILKEPGEISAEIPLSFEIEEGETVLLYETSDGFRNLIMYALTQNIGMFTSP